jgi:hypothetical protein
MPHGSTKAELSSSISKLQQKYLRRIKILYLLRLTDFKMKYNKVIYQQIITKILKFVLVKTVYQSLNFGSKIKQKSRYNILPCIRHKTAKIL